MIPRCSWRSPNSCVMTTNSDVIELADGKALVLHIMGHQPKAAKPLAEVKEQVITAIKHDKASEVARGKAQVCWGQAQGR